jgi:hypothetical protein
MSSAHRMSILEQIVRAYVSARTTRRVTTSMVHVIVLLVFSEHSKYGFFTCHKGGAWQGFPTTAL